MDQLETESTPISSSTPTPTSSETSFQGSTNSVFDVICKIQNANSFFRKSDILKNVLFPENLLAFKPLIRLAPSSKTIMPDEDQFINLHLHLLRFKLKDAHNWLQTQEKASNTIKELLLNIQKLMKGYPTVELYHNGKQLKSLTYDEFEEIYSLMKLYPKIYQQVIEAEEKIEFSDWIMIDSDMSYQDLNIKEINPKVNTKQIELDPDDECPICTENKVDETLPCSHRFCSACLKLWLIINGNRNCPICRQETTYENGYSMMECPPIQDVIYLLKEKILFILEKK